MSKKDVLKKEVYEYLYKKIVSGELLPGESIIEQDISNQINVSRTPVREAIKQLSYEGLVRNIPNRGTFVSEINSQDVEEIYFLREVLEVAALRSGFQNISGEELQILETQLLELKMDSSNESYYMADRRLHQLIVMSAGNRRLIQILDTLNAQTERLRQVSAMTPMRLKASRIEHLEILAGIKENNLEYAVEKLTLHIRNIRDSVISACRSNYLQNSSF